MFRDPLSFWPVGRAVSGPRLLTTLPGLKIATFARRLLPRQCRNRRAHDSEPAFSTVQWSVYSRIHTFVSCVAAKAEPSRFGSRCWCDITPALNTSKQKGKQTEKQKQTNESKVVTM